MTIQQTNYSKDVLGDGYEQMTLNFPDDYEGQVIATLIRKKASNPTKKAALYVHGYIDYFFQTEMAEQFNQHGFDFYAVDLRKYGRSHLPHQKFYNIHDLNEYNAEISTALDIIGNEGHDQVILCGHSTGGLITTLFAAHYPNHPLIKALWANSPFYDFNMPILKKKIALPKVSALAKIFPDLRFPNGLNKWYVPSLHQNFYGEWDFNLQWKPKSYPLSYLSYIRAIFESHKEIHQGVSLQIPALIMHSHQTKNPKKWNNDVQTSDLILDVNDIEKYAKKINGDVTTISIQNGLHDLVLSAPVVRAEVYKKLFEWLDQKIK